MPWVTPSAFVQFPAAATADIPPPTSHRAYATSRSPSFQAKCSTSSRTTMPQDPPYGLTASTTPPVPTRVTWVQSDVSVGGVANSAYAAMIFVFVTSKYTTSVCPREFRTTHRLQYQPAGSLHVFESSITTCGSTSSAATPSSW